MDAQMMSHFYPPIHPVWGSSLHPRGYPPADPSAPKYPHQYPGEQKYQPANPLEPHYTETVQERKLGSPSSPPSSPLHHLPYASPPTLSGNPNPQYVTPSGQASPMELKHEAVGGDEKEINDPRGEEKGGGGYYSGYYPGVQDVGGYSTAGSFPLSSPLARTPARSKAKNMAGEHLGGILTLHCTNRI